MNIPVIVRCVPPAVPPLDGVTDSTLTICILMKNATIFDNKLRRRRLLWDVWKSA